MEDTITILGIAGSWCKGSYNKGALRVAVAMNMYPLNRPEVMIPKSANKFDSDGKLTDQHTKDNIEELLKALLI